MSEIDVQSDRGCETLSDLVKQHDNIFKLSETLSHFLKNRFDVRLENGRTPACIAAAEGKRALAGAIIQAGGGGQVADRFGLTAEDYLRSPVTPAERQARASHDAEHMRTTMLGDRIRDEVTTEVVEKHWSVSRIPKNDS